MSQTRLKARQRKVFAQRKSDLPITPVMEEWLATHQDWYVPPHLVQLMVDLLTEKPRDRTQSFSCSSRGTCERAQVFGFMGLPTKVQHPSGLVQIFNDGKWRHARLQVQMVDAGIIDVVEHKIHLPKLRLRGSLDGIKKQARMGVEIKGIRNIASVATGPLEHHKLQGTSYVLNTPEIDYIVFFYEDKGSQQWVEHVFRPDETDVWLVEDEVRTLNEAVDNRKLPPVQEECKRGTGETFNDCPFRFSCLNIKSWGFAEGIIEAANEAAAQAVRDDDGRGTASASSDASGDGQHARRVIRKKRKSD